METIAISKIRPNEDNPRYIRDEKFKKLVQSLKDFPEMADVRPIVVNQDMVVLGGNMRLKAMQEAGWKDVPVEVVDWSDDKQREFVVKDNVGFGEWDWDELANTWDIDSLNEWGLDTPDNWGMNDDVNKVNGGDENSEWVGMPEFESAPDVIKLIVTFDNEEFRDEFVKMANLELSIATGKTWSTSWPFKERMDLTSVKYD